MALSDNPNISDGIDRREAEHRQKDGWEKGHILQVGLRTTRDAALQWEDEQRRQGNPRDPDEPLAAGKVSVQSIRLSMGGSERR